MNVVFEWMNIQRTSKKDRIFKDKKASSLAPRRGFWMLRCGSGRLYFEFQGKTSPKLLTAFSSSLTPQGNCRDKPTIEYDPKIEKTLKKNRSRVKAQRALKFEEQTANSDEGASENFSEEEIVEENSEEEIQDNMADNANNQRRTLADYTN
ncbi:hypothetical protein PIB30_084190 [Stylosanthes scabra]|uniref:Uncharacterized protein n=1 Tax=Stylosanthes scabra TaxID=79078 RepID=A0ABU6XRV1_9FABA|nr:hypothetical protein [Stylosanthes scabra]